MGLTVMLVPAKPPVHANAPPVHALAVKVVELPLHIATELGVIVGFVGIALTVTVTASLESEVQPLIVQATLYDFVAVGLTVILVPANPPVQFDIPPIHALAVKVVELPLQMAIVLGVIVGFVGTGLTVTVATSLESEVHPLIVQATLYSFVKVGLTVILVPDNPPVQLNVPPVHALAVKVVELPLQMATELGVIVGFVGMAFTVTIVAVLLGLVQLLAVQVAE